jgi:exodeoxyribonuclease-3
MKYLSWNVNGLRSLYKSGSWRFLKEIGSDFITLQEVKAEFEQLPPELQELNGYYSYFSHSTLRKGYSGVAMYSKHKPKEVRYGLGKDIFDEQGRVITLLFDSIAVIGAYFPNGGSKTASLEYKLDFCSHFLSHINSLRDDGYSIVFGGDINIAHTPIDLARPEANKTHVGFLPVERAWLDEILSEGYLDTFRYLYPDATGVYTYWDQLTRARERNVGWRIDYWFVSNDLSLGIESFKTLNDIYGSDHCPIELSLQTGL